MSKCDDLKITLEPKKALDEAQEIARETLGLIENNLVPSFIEVKRMCELILEFSKVETQERERS